MENINETDFESLSLESLNLETKDIMKELPLSSNDERLLLYKNHQLAKTLISSNDANLKLFFKNNMRTIFMRYFEKIALDNDEGVYNDLLQTKTLQEQIQFLNKMRDLRELVLDYINNYTFYSTDFALNKVIQITKYFIEFINPMYNIELDLSMLQL